MQILHPPLLILQMLGSDPSRAIQVRLESAAYALAFAAANAFLSSKRRYGNN
jgi:hypothetical protein